MKEKQCCLCPIMGGALKPTTLEGDQWCHAACMQWIPEVCVCVFGCWYEGSLLAAKCVPIDFSGAMQPE
jgi:hypothetical protein